AYTVHAAVRGARAGGRTRPAARGPARLPRHARAVRGRQRGRSRVPQPARRAVVRLGRAPRRRAARGERARLLLRARVLDVGAVGWHRRDWTRTTSGETR